MTPLRLSDIARMTGGRLHGDDVMVDAVATDTRTLPTGASRGRDQVATAQGALFVALKGESFDGHDHVGGSADKGIVALLVARQVDSGLPQVIVADTTHALAALAAGLQRTRDGDVIAITGSNGKTSVKALLLAILQQACVPHPHKAYANPGNRNNQIGLPLAVIDAPDDAQYAIYEMGAGQPGDIAYLTAIVRPDVAVVNNVAPAHLERMGSLLGVANTKAAIYDALPADGVAVINADDAFGPYFAERAHGRRLIRFGLDASADVSARDIHSDVNGSRFALVTPQGCVPVVLALPGRHNVMNALAAAALALAVDVTIDTIAAGLGVARPVSGRLATHRLANDVVLVDDSYNANPGSLNAAIDTLASGVGEHWLVLGDMRELGVDAEALHAQAGRRAKAAGIKRLYALGPLSASTVQAFGDGGRHFAGHDALAQALRIDAGLDAAAVRPGTESPPAGLRILVKGSRGSAMDRIVTALLTGELADHAA